MPAALHLLEAIRLVTKGLADAALAADDGNDLLYARTLVKRFEKLSGSREAQASPQVEQSCVHSLISIICLSIPFL